jgi:hypothetical protein
MGWGTKKAVVPQLDTRVLLDTDIGVTQNCSVCGLPQYNSPSGMTCLNGHGGAEPLEPEAADPGAKAELEFMRLQANKGWTAERRYDVLRDFVRKSGLYLELNKFVKGVR